MLAWISLRRVVLLSSLLVVGCSALLDVDDHQCTTDSDCTQRGLAGRCEDHVCVAPSETAESTAACVVDADCSGSTPSCLLASQTCVSARLDQQFSCSLPTPATTDTVHYQFNAHLLVDQAKAPENLVAKACELGDVGCSAPVDTFTDTAGDGAVQFDLPKGEPVYFELTSSNALTVLVYRPTPPEVDLQLRDVFVATTPVLESLASANNLPIDPTKGTTILEIEDCTGQPASEVHFTQNPESGSSFYYRNALPFANEVVTAYDAATGVAYGGFVNVTPGIVQFSAHWGVDGPQLRSMTAQVRANTITILELHTRVP